MSRTWAAAVIGYLFAALAPVHAQVVSVRINPKHPQANYNVDGQIYVGPAVMLWPTGSKHFLSISTHSPAPDTLLDCSGGWSATVGGKNAVTLMPVTASAELTEIVADCTIKYKLTLSYFQRRGVDTPSPGRICIGGNCVDEDTVLWVGAGTSVAAAAYPNSGYIFTGWGQLPGTAASSSTAYMINFPLNQPPALRTLFQSARPI